MTHWETVPLCDDCWHQLQPEREPVRLIDAEEERCHLCEQLTRSGIWARLDTDAD